MSIDPRLHTVPLASEVSGWAEAVAESAVPVRLAPGAEVFLSGEANQDVFILLEGALRLELPSGRSEEMRSPNLLGEMPWVLGGGRTGTLRAVSAVEGLRWSAASLAAFAAQSPAFVEVLSSLAGARLRRDQLDRQLRRWIPDADPRVIADALDRGTWTRLEAGEVLIQEGDPADRAWLMVTGRLEVHAGGVALTRIRPGETVGELGLITRQARRATVRALRRTELLGFEREAFEGLLATHPAMLRAVIGTLGDHLGPETHQVGRMHLAIVLPGSGLDEVVAELLEAISRTGPAHILRDSPVQLTGLAAQRLQVQARLDELDAEHDVLVTLANAGTPWAELTAERADRVAILVASHEPPGLADTVLRPANTPTTAVRVWPAETEIPHGSAPWLDHVDEVLHGRIGDAAHRDRIARTLVDRAVGLVIAGGAARSVAAMGVVRALQETGIPIDRVGGTSMGAVLGAALGLGWGPDRIQSELRAASSQAGALKRITLPMVSLVRGAPVVALLRARFGDLDLADLWLPVYAVSSDLTANAMVVHERGDLVSVLQASSALPGLMEPAVLEGHVHVDGAMVDNMPVAPMRARAGFIVTVDVMLPEELEVPDGAFPSPWQMLMQRAMGGSARVPGIFRILQRSTLVGAESEAARARQASDLVITPPVADVDMLDFSDLDGIVERTLRLCRASMPAWLQAHPRLSSLASDAVDGPA